jgi:hypothetical protein
MYAPSVRWLLVVAVAVLPVAARAGECPDEEISVIADEQDARAKAEHPGEPKDDYHLCIWWTLPDVPKQQPELEKRLLAACETILTKRPNDALCTEIAATFGKDKLGKTDIVAALDSFPHRGVDEHTIDLMALTGAPRAAPLIIAQWKERQLATDQHPTDSNIQNDWARWRVSAATALGLLGDATAQQFLEDQVTKKIDSGVKRVAKAAIAKISKRLTAGSQAHPSAGH